MDSDDGLIFDIICKETEAFAYNVTLEEVNEKTAYFGSTLYAGLQYCVNLNDGSVDVRNNGRRSVLGVLIDSKFEELKRVLEEQKIKDFAAIEQKRQIHKR